MALCINREFSLQLQGITLCNYRYLYSAANSARVIINRRGVDINSKIRKTPAENVKKHQEEL